MLGSAIAKRSLVVALAVSAAPGLLVARPAHAAVVDSANPSQSTIDSEVGTANARLVQHLADSHAGTPERLTHPDADHTTAHSQPLTAGATQASPNSAALTDGTQPGLDVSSYQGTINWSSVKSAGATFAYVKSTEGTYYYDSSYFPGQYNGSYSAGLIRGAYHFAIPDNSTGAAQADYFVAHGGGWTPDGHTLPGMLDVEYNPYGPVCYGLSSAQMIAWIDSFVDEYLQLTTTLPVIYTTTNWWATCTGNASGLIDSLAIANYGSSPYPLPASWSSYVIWQFADQGVFPGDQDTFRGTYQQLIEFASGISVVWRLLPGAANDVAAGADGSVWIVGATTVYGGHGIYHWTGSSWTSVPGGAVTIAVGPDGSPWVTNSINQIYHWTGTSWVRYPGAANDVAVGADGSVWIVGATTVYGGHGIYHWTGSSWTSVPGGAVTIAVGPDGSPWVTNSINQIYHWTGTSWVRYPGAANDVAVGADGSVWIVGATTVYGGHGIYHWTGSSWTSVPGGAVTIAVGPDGSPWVTNSINQTYAG